MRQATIARRPMSALACALALALAPTVTGCGSDEAVPATSREAMEANVSAADGINTETLRLGTSPFVVTIPDDFRAGEVLPEEASDDMVGYMESDTEPLAFDVYQFGKNVVDSDELDYLLDYAAKEALGYDATVNADYMNGIPIAYYSATETQVRDGKDYRTLTYLFDTDEDYVELVFWLEGEGAEAVATDIINSLDKV